MFLVVVALSSSSLLLRAPAALAPAGRGRLSLLPARMQVTDEEAGTEEAPAPLTRVSEAAKEANNVALAAAGVAGLATLGVDLAVVDIGSAAPVLAAGAAAVTSFADQGAGGAGEVLRSVGNATTAAFAEYKKLDDEYEIGVKARAVTELLAEAAIIKGGELIECICGHLLLTRVQQVTASAELLSAPP